MCADMGLIFLEATRASDRISGAPPQGDGRRTARCEQDHRKRFPFLAAVPAVRLSPAGAFFPPAVSLYPISACRQYIPTAGIPGHEFLMSA